MSTIVRTDLHSTTQGLSIVQLPYVVRVIPNTSQQMLLLQAEAVLRGGDQFDCHHQPVGGPFTQPLPKGTGQGKMAQAGQAVVLVQGIAMCTLAGTNTSCSEGVQEMTNRATVFLSRRSIVTVNGAAVLTGDS
ncbi:MAG: hypothetical protein JWM11_5312 [Planctomycetaceae bacterium]|nr:hypothetical protein [Planctomycetaceae bacterium]